MNQPVHARRSGAAGGNGIHVTFFESDRCGPYPCDLHGVWDTSMILRTGLDRQQYADRLEQLVGATKDSTTFTPQNWANQSVEVAKAAWVQDGASLDDAYYQQQIKMVDRQMAVAGMRLARLLNETIGKMTPRDFE